MRLLTPPLDDFGRTSRQSGWEFIGNPFFPGTFQIITTASRPGQEFGPKKPEILLALAVDRRKAALDA
jgi:hypothetical protein